MNKTQLRKIQTPTKEDIRLARQVEAGQRRIKIDREFTKNYREPLPMVSMRKIDRDFPKGYYIGKTGIVPPPPVKEVIDFMDTSQRNSDLPDNITFYEMGINQRQNDWMDYAELSDRDFRHRCFQSGGFNYFLELKSKADFAPPKHLNPDWLAKVMDIHHDVAIWLANAFTMLQLNWTAVVEILAADLNWLSEENVVHYIHDTLDPIVSELELLEPQAPVNADPAVKIEMDEFWLSSSIYYNPELPMPTRDLSYENLAESAIIVSDEFDGDADAWLAGDGLDALRISNPFKGHKLYSGSEALSHEFLTAIRTASSQRLKKIMAGFFPTYDERSGRKFPPKYRYLTQSQKNQAWVYINARREELKRAAYKDPEFIKAFSWLESFGSTPTGAAIIHCFANGKSFESFGMAVSFKRKATGLELKELWSRFKALKALKR